MPQHALYFPGVITDLIRTAETGSRAAADRLFATLYDELHRLARHQLSKYGTHAPLGVTTLVHEAWLDMAAREGPEFPDRARFLGYASRAMRGLVIDQIRRREADKRGGDMVMITLTTELSAFAGEQPESERLDALSHALDALAREHPGLAQLVDLHMFCGLSLVEIAALRGVSDRTARRDWKRARDFLASAMPGLAIDMASAVRRTTGEALIVGTVVGPWELVERIGEGGMGTVWRARARSGAPRSEAAVKLLAVEGLDSTSEARFRREGSVLARLNHPAIAALLGSGVTETGRPWLAMEYVDGAEIDLWCAAHALSATRRARLLLQVMAAVEYAHGQRVIHRDLKPSNILVTSSGEVRLLDFGIAMELSDADGRPMQITTEGARALTPLYAAPEQILKQPVSPATDVYALGVLMHVLLAGGHPTHQGPVTTAQVLRGILEQPPAPLGLPGFDAIAARALAKVPTDRYPTVAAMALDLEAAISRME